MMALSRERRERGTGPYPVTAKVTVTLRMSPDDTDREPPENVTALYSVPVVPDFVLLVVTK
jgi:hypothetical protein